MLKNLPRTQWRFPTTKWKLQQWWNGEWLYGEARERERVCVRWNEEEEEAGSHFNKLFIFY